MVAAIISEIEFRGDFFKKLNEKVTTIYLGGGTPSLLTIQEIESIVKKIVETFNPDFSDKSFEFTMEANPDDLTHEYLQELREVGVNRLSIGFQSFFDDHLKWMNRRHNSLQAKNAFLDARSLGFDNISIDLIFGYSLLSLEQWREEVRQLIELKPEHVSAYQLSIEPNSKLGREYERGKYIPVSDEISFAEYEVLRNELAVAGYNHYEISNFSLPGRESRHNSNYWNRTPYLGLGPGAHSYDGERRFWNIPDIKKFTAFYNKLKRADDSFADALVINSTLINAPFEEEVLTKIDKFNERLMLSLRKTEGLDRSQFKAEFSGPLFEELTLNIDAALQKGDLITDGSKVKIPPEKLFVSDGIIRDLFVITED